MGGGRPDRQWHQPRASSQANRRRQPYRGGSRESSHASALDENHAGSNEANTGYDLSGDPGRVEVDGSRRNTVAEPELADQDKNGSAQPDKRMRPETCALLSEFTLKSDDRRQDEGNAKESQLVRPTHS
jgi:hypothetical protein